MVREAIGRDWLWLRTSDQAPPPSANHTATAHRVRLVDKQEVIRLLAKNRHCTHWRGCEGKIANVQQKGPGPTPTLEWQHLFSTLFEPSPPHQAAVKDRAETKTSSLARSTSLLQD